ncbi:DUF4238 domain-containing protein [Cupriavidus basilensis]|uniref:DUF4238 domain-containing protein n=1 Tax=Cupriavidus basilensis TaxID=68895 RepID=UPI00157B14EE|nr:DUF4238 domain-containing protein [Cupriavidus basilensis]
MMNNNEVEKINQHYVSHFYLKSWSVDGIKIGAFSEGKFFTPKAKRIAFSKRFYRVNGLTSDQARLLRREAERTLPPFSGLFAALISSCEELPVRERFAPLWGTSDEIERKRTNLIEDFYSFIEGIVLVPYELLIGKKYEEVNMDHFKILIRFAFFQLTRTPKAREGVRAATAELLAEHNIGFDDYNLISSLILAERIAAETIRRVYELVVIENQTDSNFITSDSPVVNLKNPADSEMKIYWPVSPRQAILIKPSALQGAERYDVVRRVDAGDRHMRYFMSIAKLADRDQVERFNKKIWDHRHKVAFCLNEGDISELRSVE